MKRISDKKRKEVRETKAARRANIELGVLCEFCGVETAEVKQVHEDECKRRKRAHDQRRRTAMQGVVLI